MRDRLSFLGWVMAGIVALLLLVGVSFGMEAANLTWYAPWRADKQTEITRNTNSYIEGQQQIMLDAWKRYIDPNATEGQKKAAIDDWCRAANKVDFEYVVPTDAMQVSRQQGCWNG